MHASRHTEFNHATAPRYCISGLRAWASAAIPNVRYWQWCHDKRSRSATLMDNTGNALPQSYRSLAVCDVVAWSCVCIAKQPRSWRAATSNEGCLLGARRTSQPERLRIHASQNMKSGMNPTPCQTECRRTGLISPASMAPVNEYCAHHRRTILQTFTAKPLQSLYLTSLNCIRMDMQSCGTVSDHKACRPVAVVATGSICVSEMPTVGSLQAHLA